MLQHIAASRGGKAFIDGFYETRLVVQQPVNGFPNNFGSIFAATACNLPQMCLFFGGKVYFHTVRVRTIRWDVNRCSNLCCEPLLEADNALP